MEEKWKVFIQKRHSIWELSNFGRVKRNGEIWKQTLVNNYYRFCGGYFTHREVAKLFVENEDNKKYVDHIDGNSLNNKADNLRWVTASENNSNPNWIKRQKESQTNKYLNGYISKNKGKKRSEKTKELLRQAKLGTRKIWNNEHTEYTWIKI